MFKRVFSILAVTVMLLAQFTEVAKAAKFDESFYSGNSIFYYDPRCSAPVSTGYVALSGKDNLEKILQFFMKKGLSLAQASGIAGNMMAESGLDPTIIQGGARAQPGSGYKPKPGVGFGLVQWTSANRQVNLVSHIDSLGVDITDIVGQLSFTWVELSGSYSSTLTALKATDDPVQAAVIVHDGYERSADSKAAVINNRGGNAKKIYQTYADAPALSGSTAAIDITDPALAGNGSDARGPSNSTLATQGTSVTRDSSNTTDESCKALDNNSGGILSPECSLVVPKFQELVDSGRIILTEPGRQKKDLENCTTGPIECGTGGGKGGVNPAILSVTIAAAEVGGDEPIVLWSHNTGHGCDGLNHPKGKAFDLPCGNNTTNIEKCRRIIDFMIDNRSRLGLTEILWQSGYRCNSGVNCNISGHSRHIHLGVSGKTNLNPENIANDM